MPFRRGNRTPLEYAVQRVVEQLEPRWMMAAFQAYVNFQPAGTPVPAGFQVDSGAAFGDRGNGLTYGWDADNAATTRDRNSALSPDQRYDTLIHTQKDGVSRVWELAVPDGTYQVRIAAGDADNINSVYRFNAEGTSVVNGAPTTDARWVEGTAAVTVSDGRLTITNVAGASNNKICFIEVTQSGPSIIAIRPPNGATGVSRDIFVAADLTLPNAGIDVNTLDSNTVFLRRTSDGQLVPAVVNSSGGGDTIVLQPIELLQANTSYTFQVTAALLDLTSAAFAPFTSTFTTGATGGEADQTVAFENLPQATSNGNAYSALTKGPDGKLYAATIDGRVIRFPINPDGTLGASQTITSLQSAYGGPRMLTGIEFDPASTADNLVLWVSHGFFDFENAPDWTGRISRLSGANLQTVTDVVVGLPRSIRDHLNNQLDFGPDGKLYFLQGSNTAMGAPDTAWGNRPERLLSSSVLRLDPSLLTPGTPLDVKTEAGGTYNPYAPDAPLTIYATGVRNGYDLVWTEEGRLYVPTNGSAAGGNTPGFPNAVSGQRIDDPSHGPYTGPNVPALANVNTTQNDYLFRVVPGGYYGHPNPRHGEYVLNGGNPTSGVDPAEVTQYPVGTLPDVNWRGAAYTFGKNYSPNGVIQYQGNAFGGALDGKLLVVRFSGGDDIIVLTPGANGDISAAQTNITGMGGFYNPLDIMQDPTTGFLYVAEFGPEEQGATGGQRITLLRPMALPAAPAYQQDPGADGLVVFEAENNDGNVGRNGKTWTANSTAGFSGTGALQALPNTGVNQNTSFVSNSPRLDFKVNFNRTGIHHVWIRGLAPTGNDDTIHVGLDGQAVTTSDRVSGFGASYGWSKNTLDGAVATINVTSTGVHTINLFMREDGFVVDKVLLTSNGLFTPAGAGPAQSPRSGGPVIQPPAAPTTLNANATSSSSIGLTWADNANNETGYKVFRKTGAGGAYQLIHTTAAGVTSYSDTGLSAATQYFYRVAATNSAGDSTLSNEVNATTQAAPANVEYQQDPGADGLVVFEAENNDGNVARGGKTWTASSTAGFSGSGALQALPNTGVNQNTSFVTNSPRLDFKVNFTKTGVHYVWVRGLAPTGNDDTVHVGLDGQAVASADRMDGFSGTFGWSNDTIDAVVATINVTTAGIHTINLWMREDGFIVDKVLLTTNANFTPTGMGPAQSPRTGSVPTAPAAPNSLQVTASSPTQVSLSWADNSNNETGFKVLRKEGAGGTYAVVHTTAAGAVSYTDATVAADKTYFYKVVATNGVGDSTDSNEVSAATTIVAPAAPTGLNAAPASPSTVNLSWTDASGNEDGFRVHRKTGSGGTYVPIFETGVNVTSFVDGDLDAQTEYFYQVAAFNTAGENLSNEDSATTPAVAPVLTSIDINNAIPGTTTEVAAGSDYDVTSSGIDIWTTADSFRYAYKQVTGNFDVRVNIPSFDVDHVSAKAGLMARDSTAAGSRNVLLAMTVGSGFRFASRQTLNGTTTNTVTGGTVPPNVWLRLQRVGNVFTAYYGTNGVNWTQLSQMTRTLNGTLLLGLAANSRSETVTSDVQFRSFSNVVTAPLAANISWADGVDAPLAVQEGINIQVGNKLFVMGGYEQGLIATRKAHVLNLDTMTWSPIADIPNAQTHVGAATDGQFIYIAGGQVGDGGSVNATAECWKYDIANNTWHAFTALPEARIGGALAYLDGKLHYFGGDLPDRVTVSGSHWVIPTNESTGWVAKATLINPGDHIAGIAMNGKVYAVGGEHGHGSTYDQHDALSEYDPVNDVWVSKAPLSAGSSHFEGGLLVVHGRLVVLGGMIADQVVIGDIRAWDPLTNTWSAMTALPLTRKGGASAFHNDKFIYTAGRGANSSGGLSYSDETWVGQVTGGWWQSATAAAQALSASIVDRVLLAPDDEGGSTGSGDPPSHEPACCCLGCLGAVAATYALHDAVPVFTG